MIVNDKPMMNPFSTGSEMKFAKNPKRNSPAANAANPVMIASAAVDAAKRHAQPEQRPDRRRREHRRRRHRPNHQSDARPSAAYKINAPSAAYKPTTGDTPAIDAYASASGTSAAQD